MKQAATDHGDKLSSAEKDTVLDKCKDTLSWLDSNLLAEKDEINFKLQEVQKVCTPIMSKLHGSGGADAAGPGAPKGARAGQSGGPTIEEVD